MSTPFIKMIDTPRGYYFYDVNKDTIVSVSKKTYEYLSGATEELDLDSREEMAQLKKEGFLSTYRTEQIEFPNKEAIPYLLATRMKHLILQVTQACNLCCVYCPYANAGTSELQRKHESKNMNFDTAKLAIDYFFNNSCDSEELTIGFYGGEPLISFDIIKKSVEYANDLFEGRKLTYVVTTNATLLNDEMIDFFKENDFIITFSMDGPKEIHDKNRVTLGGKGTYNEATNALNKTLNKFSDSKGKIGINMVVDPNDNFDVITNWLSSDIARQVSIAASEVDNTMLENGFYATSEYTEKYEYNLGLALLEYTRFIDGLEYSFLVKSELEAIKKEYFNLRHQTNSLPQIGIPMGPCIAGQHKLFVDVYGNYYPCERVNEKSVAMKIGNINSGVDLDAVIKLLDVSKLTEEKCRNCWAFSHCDLCQCYSDGITQLSSSNKHKYCIESRDSYFNTLRGCLFISEAMEYNHVGR